MLIKKQELKDFNQYYNLPKGWRVFSDEEKRIEEKNFRDNYHKKRQLKEKLKHRLLIESSKKLLGKEKDEKWIFDLALEYLEKKNNLIALLNKEIENNKRILIEKDEEIINLNSMINQPEKKIESLINENKQLKKDLQNSQSRSYQQDLEFKDFLISEFSLDNKLKSKDLSFIFELIKEKNKIKNLEKPTSLIFNKIQENNREENNIRKDRCLCGNFKSINAKGCNNCKLEADRIRKRLGISMENAWKEVWKNFGNNNDFSQLTEQGVWNDNSK